MFPIVTTAATVQCPHLGTVQLQTANTTTIIDGAPAVLVSDVHTVAGCSFVVPGPKPQPCVTARWVAGATTAKVFGVAVVLQNSPGLCFSAEQIPQGPPAVAQVQQRARAV